MMWRHHSLSAIAEVIMGQSPPGDTYNDKGHGLPFFQGKAEFLDVYPSVRKWCTAPSRVAKENDILLSVRAPVGPTNLAPSECCVGRGLAAIRANQTVLEQQYLWFFFKYLEPGLSKLGQGSTFAAINRADVHGIRVPVPPLTEQRHIVEILDQADALRKLRAEADAKAKGILPALFTEMFGDPGTWRSHPSSRPLGDLVDLVSGATPSKKNEEFWGGDIPWVSPKDMKVDFIKDSRDHVSATALEETNLKLVDPGNVLLVVRGMILVHSVPVALTNVPVTINQDMKVLVPRDSAVSGSYLWAALRVAKPLLRSLVRTAAHGTRKLDTPDLLQLRLVKPSTQQLKKCESAVNNHRALLEAHEARQEKIGLLFEVLIHRAFAGTLTASWREAHMKELLQEMQQQARALGRTSSTEAYS